MTVVDEHVAAKGFGSIVVNTACTISYVAHDDSHSFGEAVAGK